jgi:hypothetical protein
VTRRQLGLHLGYDTSRTAVVRGECRVWFFSLYAVSMPEIEEMDERNAYLEHLVASRTSG